MVFNVTQSLPPAQVFYPTPAGGNFNGTTTYLNKASTIYGSNSSQCTISVWAKQSVNTGFHCIVEGRDNAGLAFAGVNWGGGRIVTYTLDFTSGTKRLNMGSSISYFSTTEWLHILASWDTNFSSGSRLSNLYINDISDKTIINDDGTAYNQPYSTMPIWDIGSISNGAPGNLWNGDISQLYFCPGTYLDFSIIANRRKFISDTKRPVYLGPTGNLPTGSSPALFMQGVGTGFNVNSGSGGNFTTNGTLGTPSTTPSNP